jgi:outer membrane protein TolC
MAGTDTKATRAGLPIEVLQAIQSPDATQRELVDATVDFNVAQFQLQRALGWPVK